MNVKIGTYSGNGSDNRGIEGIGFAPDFVLIKGGANEVVARSSTMSGDSAKGLNGAAALTANWIQSLDADGFTVGTDAKVNASGTTYYYIALKNAAADCKTLSYEGNGADNRSITGAGFQPDLVILMAADGYTTFWRSSTMSGDDSYRFGNSPQVNRIQALESDGFQVGTANESNRNLTVYHALCVKNATGVFKVLSYTGNGADDRGITGAGFQPQFAWTKEDDSSVGALRFKDQSGDNSFLFDATTTGADRIQAFQSDGFQVGTANAVNVNGSVYHAVVWKDAVPNTTTTQTQTAKARLQATTTQTQTAKSRLQATVLQTLTTVARIQTTLAQTQLAQARIQITSLQTQTAKARIESQTTQTIGGIARLQATTTKTQTAVGRVQATVAQTQSAQARIQATAALQTQTAKANIVIRTTQTQPSVGRIQATIVQTQTAKARLQTTVLQTQAARARLQIASAQTQTARARIQRTVTQTIGSVARIKIIEVASIVSTLRTATVVTVLSAGKITPTIGTVTATRTLETALGQSAFVAPPNNAGSRQSFWAMMTNRHRRTLKTGLAASQAFTINRVDARLSRNSVQRTLLIGTAIRTLLEN